MTLDLVIAVGTTAAAAMIVAVLSLSIAASRAAKIALAAVLTLWFVVTVTLAATGAVSPADSGRRGSASRWSCRSWSVSRSHGARLRSGVRWQVSPCPC